jgi:hypothetical protein
MTPGDRAQAFVDEILIPREVDAELGRLTPDDVALIRRSSSSPRPRRRPSPRTPRRRAGGVVMDRLVMAYPALEDLPETQEEINR